MFCWLPCVCEYCYLLILVSAGSWTFRLSQHTHTPRYHCLYSDILVLSRTDANLYKHRAFCIITRNITPCSPSKVNRRFGGTYRLHILGQIRPARCQRESRWRDESSIYFSLTSLPPTISFHCVL
jgi:hypothetical protein